AKDKIENAKNTGPKTEAWQKPWNAHGEKFRKHKDTAWGQAWKAQEHIYTWPVGMPVRLLYPSDNFSLNERSTYKNTLYRTQLEGLETIAHPVEFDPKVVIPQQVWDANKAPTREECWLAQEDLCVKRELLWVVRDTLDAVARFHDVKIDEKK